MVGPVAIEGGMRQRSRLWRKCPLCQPTCPLPVLVPFSPSPVPPCSSAGPDHTVGGCLLPEPPKLAPVNLFTPFLPTAHPHQVLATLPMVAFFLPFDAIASIMDGSLMAAKQTDYLSYIQIAGAGVQVKQQGRGEG